MNSNSFFPVVLRIVKDIKQYFKGLNPVLRAVVLLFLKSIIISTILGGLAPLASAVYAMKLGIRVPIEGVPYLSATIATWSFVAFVATAASLMIVTALVLNMHASDFFDGKATQIIEKIIPQHSSTEEAKIKEKFYKIASFLKDWSPIIFSLAVLLIVTVFPFFIRGELQFTYFFALFLAGCYLSASLVKTNIISFLSVQLLYSVLFTFVMVASLFAHDTYGSFLRVIRYGGGLKTTLQLTEPQSKSFSGYLLMQNDDVMVMMNDDEQTITEIPVGLVASRTVELFPAWKTPKSNISGQSQYFWFDPRFLYETR